MRNCTSKNYLLVWVDRGDIVAKYFMCWVQFWLLPQVHYTFHPCDGHCTSSLELSQCPRVVFKGMPVSSDTNLNFRNKMQGNVHG